MKTKIEKLIAEAREANEKMFAAFEEMNESLSEKQEPKFKVGDWVRGYDGKDFKVIQRTFALTTRGKSWVYLKDTKGDCQDWYLESQLEKWLPKSGEYIYCKDNLDGFVWLSICNESTKPEYIASFADYCLGTKKLFLYNDFLIPLKNKSQALHLLF